MKATRFPWVRPVTLKSGAVRYQATRRIDGKRSYGRLCEDARDAFEEARSWDTGSPKRKGKLTFGEACELVRQELTTKRAEGTVRWFETQLRALRKPWPDDLPLAKITAAGIERFIQDRLIDVSPATVNQHLRALSRILRFAIKKRFLTSNPLLEVDAPKAPTPRMHTFSATEVTDTLAKIRAAPGTSKRRAKAKADADLIEFTYLTGLRRAELGRLAVGDIDLASNLVFVRGKTDTRQVPLGKHCKAIAARLIKGREPTESLFRLNAERVARVFQHWQKKLDEPRLHAHALRHAFASQLVRKRHDQKTVATLLGHKGLQMLNRYLHAHGDAVRAAVEDLHEPATRAAARPSAQSRAGASASRTRTQRG